MRKSRLSKGFTLVELMITVAIIGILAATATTLFKDQQLRSKRAEGTTNVEALAKLAKGFFGEQGSYPGVLAPEPPPPPGPEALPWPAAASAVFAQVGFSAEGAVRYRYDIDTPALGECGCPSGACFTAVAYSDLEGDTNIGGVGYYHPDPLGLTCPTALFGFTVPFDGGGNPIIDAAVPLNDPLAVPGPDDY